MNFTKLEATLCCYYSLITTELLSSLTAHPGHCDTQRSMSRLHETQPVLRSCRPEQIALSQAGRSAGQLPAGADRGQGGGRTPGCSCQIVCRADHPDFRRFLRSVELITYWTCPYLLLSSLREMTNFMRLKAAGMSLKVTCSVSHRKPVKDRLGGGLCPGVSPLPQKHLSSPVHERLIHHQCLP